ncbi:hypothetical protein [uncultured Limimaricola sp.]
MLFAPNSDIGLRFLLLMHLDRALFPAAIACALVLSAQFAAP